MIVYLYAIVDGLQDVDGLSGLSGAPLQWLGGGGVLVAADTLPRPPDPTREMLTAQDAIVRLLHARTDATLPMQFGAAFASPADAATALGRREAALREALSRVRHRDQMTLRVLGDREAAAPGPKSAAEAREERAGPVEGAAGRRGTQYLLNRAAASTPPAIQPLLAALSSTVRGSRVEAGRGQGVVATVYHLIDRGAAEEYVRQVQASAAAVPALSIRVSGPGPCYAFTA